MCGRLDLTWRDVGSKVEGPDFYARLLYVSSDCKLTLQHCYILLLWGCQSLLLICYFNINASRPQHQCTELPQLIVDRCLHEISIKVSGMLTLKFAVQWVYFSRSFLFVAPFIALNRRIWALKDNNITSRCCAKSKLNFKILLGQ